ncbi:hypothetical protein CYLTODRAFT_376076 [Cylindrobasidium torrendii FP15055 ss-10]|uniref:DUF6535 domain-containing protein n=1 Tax=Cylindrobasidium torrendii FP15055 ss-10 TaxID=1314674 RepID=A0A0D7BA49_9AGAR|nr:hypothetical protein CYLTODRAFT_376076 [Cylindrobasidium torrendii FP15055 ss-10]
MQARRRAESSGFLSVADDSTQASPLLDGTSSSYFGLRNVSERDEKSAYRSNSLSDVDGAAYGHQPSHIRQSSFYAPGQSADSEEPELVEPDLWGPDEPPHYHIPKTTDPWKKCRVRVDNYDRVLCRGWADDIDTLLVFAGLFSAIVTAFVVETFQWLEEDSGDMTVEILQQISLQLSDPSLPPWQDSGDTFVPDPVVVRVNTFWFASLGFSLITALMGILCKQWLYEFRREAGLSNQRSLALRQMRMISLERWRVPSIINFLPLLLQLSLILFFIGLIDLLWSYEIVPAALTTVVIGGGLLFVIATSVIPGIIEVAFPDTMPCAYKSSQAWVFFRLLQWSTRETYAAMADWNVLDARHMERKFDDYLAGALVWVDDKFCQKKSMIKHLFHCLQDIEPEVAAKAVVDSEDLEWDGSIERILLDFLRYHPLDENARNYFVETVLRDINNSPSFMEVSPELLAVLKEQLPATRSAWSSFPDDLSFQIMDCLRSCVRTDRISPLTLPRLWQINDGFIKHGPDRQRQHALLLVKELEIWLARAPTDDARTERSLACVEMLLSRKNGHRVLTVKPDAARAFSGFVEALEGHMSSADVKLQAWLLSGWRELKLMISTAEQPSEARRWSIG